MHQHLLSERRPLLTRSQPVRLHVRLQARLHRQVLPADDRPVRLDSMQERRRLSLRTECPLLQMPSWIHWSLVTELLDFSSCILLFLFKFVCLFSCETAINYCETSPCQNGGVCTSSTSGFSCKCVAGWEGQRCETPLDHCMNQPCGVGTCFNQPNINSFVCACPVGKGLLKYI